MINPGRTVLLMASQSELLRERVPDLPFVRRAVSRFMPGEDIEDALAASEGFRTAGLPTVLTQLGENITNLDEAEEVTRHYIGVLDLVSERGLDTEISIKPTQLGLDLDVDHACENVSTLAQRAAEDGNWVWVDMEASPYVDVTLDLYRRVRADYANVGICLQSYLYRTAADLQTLLPLQPAIRLVKGAYKEPRSVAFPKKSQVDESFLDLSRTLLEAVREDGIRVGMGTHDPRMISGVVDIARTTGLEPDAFEIQMLYGIRRDDQNRLASQGHAVRVLISYGPSWYPWYMRRLAERPANVWFVVKNLAVRT